jgi:hypothetical protein
VTAIPDQGTEAPAPYQYYRSEGSLIRYNAAEHEMHVLLPEGAGWSPFYVDLATNAMPVTEQTATEMAAGISLTAPVSTP